MPESSSVGLSNKKRHAQRHARAHAHTHTQTCAHAHTSLQHTHMNCTAVGFVSEEEATVTVQPSVSTVAFVAALK